MNVIEYEGENVTGYANALLSAIGYKEENVGMWNWSNDKSEERFNEIMREEGFERGTHTYTKYSQEEKMLEKINELVAIFAMIKRNKLIKNVEDVKEIKEQLSYKNITIRQAVVEQEKGLSIFIEQLAKEQIILPDDLKQIIINMPKEDVYNRDINFTDIVPENIERKEEYGSIIKELKVKIENYNEQKGSESRMKIADITSELIEESVLIGIEKSKEKEEINEIKSTKYEKQL